uniref:C2H2-type domain-containing protein n=1 Tax=Salarias fasciatus TaxID=181472 RepID=A0A672H307_SALFA
RKMSMNLRFLLKMKLRKRSRKKYEVVKGLSVCDQQHVFSCWFCGRLFHSQEDWIGHGQRDFIYFAILHSGICILDSLLKAPLLVPFGGKYSGPTDSSLL